MLNWIIAFSLKNRLFIVITAIVVAWFGAYTALKMPIDVLPDLDRPTVTIISEAHAMVPEDVERLVTRPIEQVLNGATGVTRVRSVSGLGLSVIYVEFGWNTEIFRNRQIVAEKLQLARSKLPEDVDVQLAPISSIMGQVQLIGIQSKSGQTDVASMRAIADQTIKPRLLSVAGVAQTTSIGGASRQLQITVDAEKLRIFDVTLSEVEEAVKKTNVDASGGYLNIGATDPVITVTGRALAEDQIASAVIRPDSVRPIRISDVADVHFGPASVLIGEAGVGGKPGVIMTIFKQPETDTTE
ncbi:MAG TPA: efflux RND transporter permease subunit, partial [Planctomycetota bacterium]|nr:efflux RND transporter permease subunit [Planctomycetota bacterium]